MTLDKEPAIDYPMGEYPDVEKRNQSVSGGSKGSEGEREQWGNKWMFVLSCISLSVGLGNVWRFPYLAYANGGGAFLIPYLLLLFLCGRPMYFMEVAFGQYHSEGPVTVWKKTSPIGRGIGFSQMIIQFFTGIYYIIIMTWTMLYFWTTFIAACKNEPVPWDEKTFCASEWANKTTCGSPLPLNNSVPVLTFSNDTEVNIVRESAAQQYFDRYVLWRVTSQNDSRVHDIENTGQINKLLLACLAGSWLIVCGSLLRGVKTAGKVVYVTSTLPFVVLIILLGIGASLPNAVDGVLYFLIPKFDKLLTITTWRNAAEQMFYSLSVSFGSLVMLGSYNKFKHNCYQDSMIVSVLDTTTSITAGLAMFSILGYMAGRMNVGVDKVVSSGPGLAFVVFPEAITTMPAPHLWAILFFIMLYMLGLGSEIATVETVLTVIVDKWPSLRKRRPLLCFGLCLFCFLVGLPFITQGGIQLFDIFDKYAGGFAVLFPATFEIICLMWVYGLKRFLNDMKEMLGDTGKLGLYWKSTWGFLAPVTLIFILIITFANYEPLTIETKMPAWTDGLGWGLAGISIIQIPLWAIITVATRKNKWGFWPKLKESLWPEEIMIPAASGMHLSTITPGFSAVSTARATPTGDKFAYDNPTFKDPMYKKVDSM